MSDPSTKQYVTYVAGLGIAVTFTPAEEQHVRQKAARRGVTVVALIEQAAYRRLRAARSDQDKHEVIARAIKDLASTP